MNNLKFLEECIVDADNVFKARGITFKISPSVSEYRVFNSYKNTRDFTNESEMSSVLVYINKETLGLVFLNEHKEPITKLMVMEDSLL